MNWNPFAEFLYTVAILSQVIVFRYLLFGQPVILFQIRQQLRLGFGRIFQDDFAECGNMLIGYLLICMIKE